MRKRDKLVSHVKIFQHKRGKKIQDSKEDILEKTEAQFR